MPEENLPEDGTPETWVAEAWAAQVRAGLAAVVPPDAWAEVWLWVPHRAAAAAVRAALAAAGPGWLPQVLSLDDPDTVASLLGVAVPPPADEGPVRRLVYGALRRQNPVLEPARVVAQVEALLPTLNLLAAYEVSPAALQRSVPGGLEAAWRREAGPLLPLWRRVAPQAAAWLPAGRRVALWRALLAKLGQVDARHVGLGGLPEEPVLQQVQAAVAAQPLALGGPAAAARCHEAPDSWAEVAAVGHWVLQQLHMGVAPVAVVAGGAFAARLQGWLWAEAGVCAARPGGMSWADTPAGAALQQDAQAWRQVAGAHTMAAWVQELNLNEGMESSLAGGAEENEAPHPPPVPPGLQVVMAQLAALPGRWSAPLAEAWLAAALASPAPAAPRDERVQILPPEQAGWRPFAAVWVAELVEGVWPARGDTGGLGQAQRASLGLPTALTQAARAATLLRELTLSAPQVVLSRARHDDSGNALTPSRWWPQAAPRLAPLPALVRAAPPAAAAPVAAWRVAAPVAGISASLLGDLLTCPYRGYAARVLGLAALPALQGGPDPREAGDVLHAWLEAGAKRFPTPGPVPEMAAWLEAEGRKRLGQAKPLTQALWEAKLPKLAHAVATRWALEGRTLSAERWVTQDEAGLTFRAKADVLARDGDGVVVRDYKTGQPPGPKAVLEGTAPQLPFEAWLLGARGETVTAMEVWQVRGFGEDPLPVVALPLASVAKVAPTLAALRQAELAPGAAWVACPDNTTELRPQNSLCGSCDLAGLCRRLTAAQPGDVSCWGDLA